MEAMFRHESPVFSYTYINKAGDKKTINNVWSYIKSLQSNDDKTTAKRILSHVIYYLMSGGDNPKYYNKIYVSSTTIKTSSGKIVKLEPKISDEIILSTKSSTGADLSGVEIITSDPNKEKGILASFVPTKSVLDDNGYTLGYLKDVKTRDLKSSELKLPLSNFGIIEGMVKCYDIEHYIAGGGVSDEVKGAVARTGYVLEALLKSGAIIMPATAGLVDGPASLHGFRLYLKNRKKQLFTGTISQKTEHNMKFYGLDIGTYYDISTIAIISHKTNSTRKTITLPLKSSDGKTLIDVMNSKEGVFELQEYNFGKQQAQQKRMKAEWDEAKKNETAGNTTAFYKQDPDSFATAKSQNRGKQKFETGSLTSVSKSSAKPSGKITITRTKR